jgi:hypothetical protein
MPSIAALRLATAAALTTALTAQASLIQGPTFILATTTLAACEVSTCAGYGLNINEIADGDTGNLNGWAGQTGLLGTIKLDLLGTFDLDSFSLWNDVNVVNEGVRLFQLHFYGAADQLLSSTGTLAAGSQFPAQVYDFVTVQGVSRVDMQVLSASGRIEIREVAFNGEAVSTGTVPEPGGALLAGLGLALMAAQSRLRRR